jgi:hypothetical protein
MAWGVLGVTGLLVFAVYRLAPMAFEAFETGLTPFQWLATILVVAGMAYAEGYRGFQLKFSPRTAARIRYLRDRPSLRHSLLAPLFAMGFFHAARRTKITAFAVTISVIALVILVQLLDQPWRGIVDAGVVVGLSWGILSLAVCVFAAVTRETYDVSPELP